MAPFAMRINRVISSKPCFASLLQLINLQVKSEPQNPQNRRPPQKPKALTPKPSNDRPPGPSESTADPPVM